jgi:hypothetical protein
LHYAHVSDHEQVAGHFNAVLSAKVVVFLDEAFFAGDKREEGTVKRIITEDTLMIEPKGVDPFPEPNYLHILMATNNDWAIPAGLEALDSSRCRCRHESQGLGYLKAIEQELDDGGREALLAVLQQEDLTDFTFRKVPQTEELHTQKLATLRNTPHLEWLVDCITRGNFGPPSDDKIKDADSNLITSVPDLGWPEPHVWTPVDTLYGAYETWCTKRRLRPISAFEFGRVVGTKFLWAAKPTVHKHHGTDTRCGKLRPLKDLRKTFLDVVADPEVQKLFKDDVVSQVEELAAQAECDHTAPVSIAPICNR